MKSDFNQNRVITALFKELPGDDPNFHKLAKVLGQEHQIYDPFLKDFKVLRGLGQVFWVLVKRQNLKIQIFPTHLLYNFQIPAHSKYPHHRLPTRPEKIVPRPRLPSQR